MIKAYTSRKENESKEKITLAYITSRWTAQWFSKKSNQPKSLEEYLKVVEPKTEMTNDQMLAVVKNLNAMFDGEVRTDGN